MSQDKFKRQAAEAAMKYVKDDMIVGVGTGSTVNHFIDLLATVRDRIEGAVSSSAASTRRLQDHDIPVLALNDVDQLPLYVDGADEADHHRYLIKGGGDALTGEKIVAAVSRQFICIIDESKLVRMLGGFPLPVEVIPMARSHVGRKLAALGGQPELRQGFTTEHGNLILDVHNLKIMNPVEMEQQLNQIAGVVSNGLFAQRPADRLLVAGSEGVKEI